MTCPSQPSNKDCLMLILPKLTFIILKGDRYSQRQLPATMEFTIDHRRHHKRRLPKNPSRLVRHLKLELAHHLHQERLNFNHAVTCFNQRQPRRNKRGGVRTQSAIPDKRACRSKRSICRHSLCVRACLKRNVNVDAQVRVHANASCLFLVH